MNGKYSVASGANQDVNFNDDYTSKGHEYFDVWAPEIATHYGEVFWTSQGTHPLPAKIIERFAGKVIAITGYETDQVMVNPVGHPGINPDKDVSVPINWAYDHHYMAWMVGNYSTMKEVRADPDDVSAHGSPTKWMAVDKPNAKYRRYTDVPTNQMFSEGNGGEARRSFHGYPDRFAQLLESPQSWHITPMQIDTRNRDCGVTPADIKNCTQFVPGPEPRQARYGRGIPVGGTNYSGVLECPCNSRYGGDPGYYPTAKTKMTEHEYHAVIDNACQKDQKVADAKACFSAAAVLGIKSTSLKNVTVSDKSLPTGCSVMTSADGSGTVYFNSVDSTITRNTSQVRSGKFKSAVGVTLGLKLDADVGSIAFTRSKKGEYCSLNHQGVLGKYVMANTSLSEASRVLEQCESFCKKTKTCWGCSVDCSLGTMTRCQWVAIPSCGAVTAWQGLIQGDISQKSTSGNATITVSGPSNVWFGVGFNAVNMADQPYTLIITASGVMERKLGTCGTEADHCPGDLLNSSLVILSNKVVDGIRTVVATRPFQGATPKHYSFNLAKDVTIKFISAIGSSPTFAYHKAHASNEMTLTTDGEPTCICDAGANGKLCNYGGTGCNSFVKNCDFAERGDPSGLSNPTCNSRQYGGGLRCCGHGRIMLDHDQEIRPELLRYHMKFRFWFQEYKPATKTANASHNDLPRIYVQTESHAGEYDIPPAFAIAGKPIPGYPNWPLNKPTPGTTCTGKCPDGPHCECIHTITYHWTVSNMRLIYAGGHCHAPSCISLELYRNDTGTPQLICRQIPKYGTGNFPADKFDEAGYLALPPCLWDPDKGLEPSQLLPHNTPLFSIKKNRNTHTGHFGEMASWQMRGVYF